MLQLLVAAAFAVLLVWGVIRAFSKGLGSVATLTLIGLSLLTIGTLALVTHSAWHALTIGPAYQLSEVTTSVVIFGVMVGVIWLLGIRRGVQDSDDTILRGSRLLSGSHLNQVLYGPQWSKAWEAQTLGNPKVIRFGDALFPPEFEAQHLMVCGTTGSGKTQAINRVMKAVRARGKRAMVADAGSGFLSRFYQPGDHILNPFDARSVAWSPFAEVRSDYDFARIAKATIPDGSGESAQWHQYAQTLLGETMLAMYRRGDRSLKKTLHYVTVADSKELGELLSGTPAGILCVKGNDKMLSNTRGIISIFLVVWRYLPDDGDFSVREWVRREAKSGWLFVPFRDDQLGMLKTLIATFLEIGIVEALSLSEDPNRDLWFVMDEVDSLGKITSLNAALSKLRKYGCKCVLGLQTIAQLRATYGDDGAQSLLANMSTKLILRAGDGETAEYFSAEFGDQEVERTQHSLSNASMSGTGSSSTSTSANQTRVREIKRTLLASDISALRDLQGFLKIAASPIGLIALVYEQIPQTTPGHVENDAARIHPISSTPAAAPAPQGPSP